MTDEKYIDKILKSRNMFKIAFGDFLSMNNPYTSADIATMPDRMVMMSTPMGGGGNTYYDEPTQSLHINTVDNSVVTPNPYMGIGFHDAATMHDAMYSTVNIGDL